MLARVHLQKTRKQKKKEDLIGFGFATYLVDEYVGGAGRDEEEIVIAHNEVLRTSSSTLEHN